ncbi:MAG: HDOD domain-containing protein [Deltaproteobacteria bacterium]|nr:HDOD domain-containing protein [Deltaproteobacteria bacterium]
MNDLVARGALPLPLLPEAAAQVLALVERPNCNASQLAEVIRRDPALTTHVLRMAASPVYAASTKLVSLQQVIARIGFSAILEIALVVASKARVFENAALADEVRADFKHSFVTALFAQEIARVRRATVDIAFIAGLLHDIGRPILLDAMVRIHRDLCPLPDTATLVAAADEAHAQVGGTLAESWKLPPRVAEAIRRHHTPAGVELAMTVALADAFAHAGGLPADGAEGTQYAAALSLVPDDLTLIGRKAEDIARTADSIA